MEVDPVLQQAIGGIVTVVVVQVLKKLKILENPAFFALSSLAVGVVIAVGYGALVSPGYAALDIGKVGYLVVQGGLIGLVASGSWSSVKNTLGM